MPNVKINNPFERETKPQMTASLNDGGQNAFVLPAKRERRSKRLLLMIRPSIYEQLKADAAKQNRTLNDLLNCLCETYLNSL